jgi:hypothetical protein
MISSNTYTINVTAYDNYDTLIADPLLTYGWTIHGGKAQFDSLKDGQEVDIKAMEEGTGEIEATVRYYNMTANLRKSFEVVPNIYYFGVNPTNPVVKLGETLTLTANAVGVTNTNLTAYSSVKWSIDDGYGYLDYSPPGTTAVFTPEKTGWVTVNATLSYLDDIIVNITRIFVPQPLNRISISPGSAFVYFEQSTTFNITAYDSNDFRIMDTLSITVDVPNFLGDVDIAEDGHSFVLTGYNQGTEILVVYAEYYGYKVTGTVEVTIPQALENIKIISSNDPIFATQSVEFSALVKDIDGSEINKGLTFNWTFPASASNPQYQNDKVILIPTQKGPFNINVSILYFGLSFEKSVTFNVLSIIDKIQIEVEKQVISENEKLELRVKALDENGQEITSDIIYSWEASKGEIDSYSGNKINFKSSTAGTYKIKVIAKLSNYHTIAQTTSVTITVVPDEPSAGWLEKNTAAVLSAVLIAVVLVLIILFLIIRKKKVQEKNLEEDQLISKPKVTRPSPGSVFDPSKELPEHSATYGQGAAGDKTSELSAIELAELIAGGYQQEAQYEQLPPDQMNEQPMEMYQYPEQPRSVFDESAGMMQPDEGSDMIGGNGEGAELTFKRPRSP